jgi:hypothetical protein
MFGIFEGGMRERDRLRWERTRRVGKLRFLVIHGVLIRGSLLFALATLIELLGWHEQLSLHLIEANSFVWFFGALIGSLWEWDQNESIYRVSRVSPDRQDRLIDDATGKEG